MPDTRRWRLLTAGLVAVVASGCGTRSVDRAHSPAAAPVHREVGAVAAPAGQPPSAAPATPVANSDGAAVPGQSGGAAGRSAAPGRAPAWSSSSGVGPGAERSAAQSAPGGSTPTAAASGSPSRLPVAPSPGAPGAPPGGGDGGPRSEVVVGSVGTISGVAGEILAGYVRGAQVWVRRDAPALPRTCGTAVVIKGGRYTAPNGFDLTCAD